MESLNQHFLLNYYWANDKKIFRKKFSEKKVSEIKPPGK